MEEHKRNGWYLLGGLPMTGGVALAVGWLIAVESAKSPRPQYWEAPAYIAVGLVGVGFLLVLAVMYEWHPKRFLAWLKKRRDSAGFVLIPAGVEDEEPPAATPNTLVPPPRGPSPLGRSLQQINEMTAKAFAPTGKKILDAAIDAAMHERPEPEPEIPAVVADPDADWPNQCDRIRGGMRLRIQRPPRDSGLLLDCVVRDSGGRSWRWGTSILVPMPGVLVGRDMNRASTDFPHHFAGGQAAMPLPKGTYTYRWRAEYGNDLLAGPSSTDVVARGEFSI